MHSFQKTLYEVNDCKISSLRMQNENKVQVSDMTKVKPLRTAYTLEEFTLHLPLWRTNDISTRLWLNRSYASNQRHLAHIEIQFRDKTHIENLMDISQKIAELLVICCMLLKLVFSILKPIKKWTSSRGSRRIWKGLSQVWERFSKNVVKPLIWLLPNHPRSKIAE